MGQADARRKFISKYPGTKRRGKKGHWYRCAHCGKWCGRPGSEGAKIADDEKMEVDHIIPWSKGGSDDVHNLQPLCKPCNRGKSNNATVRDGFKTFGNAISHPVDTLVATPLRKAARQNPILKGLGITKRK